MEFTTQDQIDRLRDLRPWQCHAYFRNEEGELFHLGSLKLWAEDADDAKGLAFDELWDNRLDAESFEEAEEIEEVEVGIDARLRSDPSKKKSRGFGGLTVAGAIAEMCLEFPLSEYVLDVSIEDEELNADLPKAIQRASETTTRGDVLREVARLGLASEDLDELVHDCASRLASEVNNRDTDAQVEFLIERLGIEGALGAIQELAEPAG